MFCKGCPLSWLAPVAVFAGAVALIGQAGGVSGGQPAKDQPGKSQPSKGQPGGKDGKPAPKAETPKAEDAYVLGFKMKRIDGKEEELATYKGKVVMMVNVASQCGYTGQYAALEEFYLKHKDHGLVILGFPANDFGSQEPGTNEEIQKFCDSKYHVTFPMFEKISVKGKDQHPLYKKLASLAPPLGGDPKWNFTKFIVDKDGKAVGRFDAKGDSGDRSKLEPGLIKKVEELLGVKDTGKKEEKAPSGS